MMVSSSIDVASSRNRSSFHLRTRFCFISLFLTCVVLYPFRTSTWTIFDHFHEKTGVYPVRHRYEPRKTKRNQASACVNSNWDSVSILIQTHGNIVAAMKGVTQQRTENSPIAVSY